MENLKEKVIIVTGASSGIGEATARLLARKGAKVVLAARRAELLQSIVNNIKQEGGEAAYFKAEVTSPEDMQSLAQFANKQYGRIDVLVNNAGYQELSLLKELKIEEWSKTIDVNIKGVLYAIAAVLPTMREQKSGHIINISSVMGHKVIPTTTVYSATKSAVLAISEGLRQEESPESHIRSTIVSPGMTATGVLDEYAKYPSLSPNAVARAIAYAINEPEDTGINEILLRPTLQSL